MTVLDEGSVAGGLESRARTGAPRRSGRGWVWKSRPGCPGALRAGDWMEAGEMESRWQMMRDVVSESDFRGHGHGMCLACCPWDPSWVPPQG